MTRSTRKSAKGKGKKPAKRSGGSRTKKSISRSTAKRATGSRKSKKAKKAKKERVLKSDISVRRYKLTAVGKTRLSLPTGRYKSSKGPYSAAQKAFGRVARIANAPDGWKTRIQIRETTRGVPKTEFAYDFVRRKHSAAAIAKQKADRNMDIVSTFYSIGHCAPTM